MLLENVTKYTGLRPGRAWDKLRQIVFLQYKFIFFKAFIVHVPATAVVKLFFGKMFDVIAVVHSLLLLFLWLCEIFRLLFRSLHYQMQGE